MLRFRGIATNLTATFIKRNQTQTNRTTILYDKHHDNIQLVEQSYGRRSVGTLSSSQITEILSANEVHLDESKITLPGQIKSIDCNQLASNNPIEDRLRISSLHLPGCEEPTLVLGVFDGHGGGTTADLISRRIFNYLALSLHPDLKKLRTADQSDLNELVIDIYNSPPKYDADIHMQSLELDLLNCYKNELSFSSNPNDIVANLKASFKRCDDDLSQEIQKNLLSSDGLSQQMLRHYLSATVSGCCAIVLVIHQGVGYVISSGDCRAVLGVYDKQLNAEASIHAEKTSSDILHALDLNDEHNCDNINEVRRLAASHPKSEQNTMIKHNRLLGHLMPFRAFGDFVYKWPADIIKACGITRAFGAGVIPSSYETPPYLIVEPDVNVLPMLSNKPGGQNKYLIMATDGLWELFESSRDVIETIVEHSNNANQAAENRDQYYDSNCATHLLRAALCAGPYQDISLNDDRIRKLHHNRLESTLTLPKSVVRNFRDDISIIILKLQ